MRCVLFDVDGVLIDSWNAYRRIWSAWAAHHDLVEAVVWAATHGRRPSETVAEVAAHLDPDTELARLERLVAAVEPDFTAYPDAAALLGSVPADRWALVTSGSRSLTRTRFLRNQLPLPRVMICAEDVRCGKPHPQPYLSAAAELGVRPGECLAVEDSPAGVTAARAAGMRVLGVLTTHGPEDLAAADELADSLAAARPAVQAWLAAQQS